MNSWKFTPKKDYSANRLLAGVLQLTDGVCVCAWCALQYLYCYYFIPKELPFAHT